MTMLDDRSGGRPAELDPATTERLLLGHIAPDDAAEQVIGKLRTLMRARAG